MLSKMDKHADLVGQMADKAGVNLGEEVLRGTLSAQGLRSAVMLCTHCQHTQECQGHLATGPDGTVPGYCLNKTALDRLAEG